MVKAVKAASNVFWKNSKAPILQHLPFWFFGCLCLCQRAFNKTGPLGHSSQCLFWFAETGLPRQFKSGLGESCKD